MSIEVVNLTTDLKGYILLKSHISLILNANKIYNELFKIFDIERE